MNNQPTRIDSLLEPLLVSAGGKQADEFLFALITTHADPLIKAIIRHTLPSNDEKRDHPKNKFPAVSNIGESCATSSFGIQGLNAPDE